MWKTEIRALSETPAETGPVDIGANLKALRLARGRTLAAAAAQCGVSAATLSRIENGQLSPTFDVVSKITEGFGVGLRELLSFKARQGFAGWRALTRAGEGRVVETPHYRLELLGEEVAAKPYLVFRAEILARAREDFETLQAHPGQEQVIVQSGRVQVWTEHYAPVELGPGDSFAFDSAMGHALVSLSPEPAVVLWVCDARETR